jgi:hypothetical protein
MRSVTDIFYGDNAGVRRKNSGFKTCAIVTLMLARERQPDENRKH